MRFLPHMGRIPAIENMIKIRKRLPLLLAVSLSCCIAQAQGLTPAGEMRTEANSKVVTEVSMETDLVVCGGGLAGVCAAVSAARHGCSVVLVQDRPMLGGTPPALHPLGRRHILHSGERTRDNPLTEYFS